MGGSGGDGGAAATPPTAPPRGASRAALLEQRKAEVQDEVVVGALVKVVYAEAWTTRAGAAMSSGYGKQVFKKKPCHIAAQAVSSQTRTIRLDRSGASYPFQIAFTPDHWCHNNVCIRMH